MMVEMIQVNTPDRSAAVDVTELVARTVREQGVKSGVCTVYVPHTTAGITINEGADPAVMQDVMNSLDHLVPWRSDYLHREGNSAAHIKAILVGGSVNIVIDTGRLLLGTWEHIFLCEFDGPRTRKLRIKIMPDAV